MHIAAGPQVISVALSLVGVVVALVLLITKARGRSRVTAIIGSVLIVLGTLSGLVYLWVLAPNAGQLSDQALVGILAARAVIASVLIGTGVILFGCAIIVASRPKKRKRGVDSPTSSPPVTSLR